MDPQSSDLVGETLSLSVEGVYGCPQPKNPGNTEPVPKGPSISTVHKKRSPLKSQVYTILVHGAFETKPCHPQLQQYSDGVGPSNLKAVELLLSKATGPHEDSEANMPCMRKALSGVGGLDTPNQVRARPR